jgi:hypothetical protein
MVAAPAVAAACTDFLEQQPLRDSADIDFLPLMKQVCSTKPIPVLRVRTTPIIRNANMRERTAFIGRKYRKEDLQFQDLFLL